MTRLVLLRHGESLWNKENRFTGWTDVGLTTYGIEEALTAGRTLRQAGYVFDVAYTSVLKRAIKTLWLVLEAMDLMWIPIHGSWRLNERHYGALQGLNKAETAARYEAEQTTLWRRSYDVRPPALTPDDPRYPGREPRYAGLCPQELPCTESLKDTMVRLLPYWHATIASALQRGERVLIAAHGNSLRALVKYLEAMPDDVVVLTCIACLDKSTAGIFARSEPLEGLCTEGKRYRLPHTRAPHPLRGVASVKRCPCRWRLRQRYGLEKAAPRADRSFTTCCTSAQGQWRAGW